MFQTLLIANRGEIACRIIRTAKRLGITTVAVYSTADEHALHVRLADLAYYLGESPPEQSYLNVEAIITAAEATQADAIHPGYGFLSESVLLAKACLKATITFVGPPIEALEIMGSKQKAKHCLKDTAVPLIPGYHGTSQADLRSEAKHIGFPLLIKAAAGGGGKGMRTVSREAEFMDAMAGAQREALAYFKDDTLILEKLIMPSRHIEVQIMADELGNVVHLFDRECSLQRRHQKIIEEAPAPHLSAKTKTKLYEAACTVAKTINYVGAGTIEFLVDDQEQFYFMEMNTRLQVEHPVTEAITGLDLVEWQLRLANHEKLPLTQSQLTSTGHALECRIYAEDPANGFLPSSGTLTVVNTPTKARLDTGFESGDALTPYYDPLIAKLITHGQTREDALIRMQQALTQYALYGVTTNLAFLQAICHHPEFVQGPIYTDFLATHPLILPPPVPLPYLLQAFRYEYRKAYPTDPIAQACFGFHPFLPRTWDIQLELLGKTYTGHITALHATEFTVQLDDEALLSIQLNTSDLRVIEQGQSLICFHQGIPQVLSRPSFQTHATQSASHHKAPMPGTVVTVLKQQGDAIKTNEPVLIIEAMKMEHTIRATQDGIIAAIFYQKGDQVAEGTELFTLKDEHALTTE